MKAGIVGAGIMGRLIAFSLVNAGWNVTLIDENESPYNNSCSMAAAGLLTPITELDKSERIIFDLGLRGLKTLWPEILQQLPTTIYFQNQGSLAIAHPRDQADLTHFIELIANKLNAPHFYKKLNATEFSLLEPNMAPQEHAYHFQQEGNLDNQAVMNHLADYLIKKITWLNATKITAIKPQTITIHQETKKFDWVFDCRGLGAKSTFTNLRGVRGELIWLHAPHAQIKHPIRFLHPRYRLYLAPRANQHYILGASEIESEDTDTISVRTALELLTAAYAMHRGFLEANIIKTMAHCRPTLSHHLPCIKYQPGFIAINGLYRHGFLIAPSLAEEMMRYLQNGSSHINYPNLWEKMS